MVLVCFVFIAKTQPNIFKESLVTSVTPWEIIEESDVFPDNFSFPAYTGSGIIFYGLDATGFQSINFDLSTKWIPSNGGTADDLYVFHKRMHSNHLGWDDIGKYPVSQMPLGYMSFSIIVDGQRIAPGLFIYTAKNWRRKTDLKSGLITTSYDLPQGVRLEVAHLLVMNTITPQYRVSVSSIDNRPHTVDFRYETKVRTRDGKPIWDDFPEFHYDSDKG
ncbi:MAG: hypothetical protein KI790_10965, partial [Cyclobacteriaceae bacterium]|nr:hypothetical protein [Cyclobacteriaceae bacterium HetDA_MAG_MS6]